MLNSRSLLHHSLSVDTFAQVQDLLQQMAQLQGGTIVSHADLLAVAEPNPIDPAWFSVVVSPAFSALLTGVKTEESVQTQLTFAPEAIAETSKPTIPSGPAFGRIVLLADDENADVICDLLTAAGYQLIWMSEGSSAVTQIEILQPLLIIVDTQLSNGDIYEVLRDLKQNPATHHLPIVALVASSSFPSESATRSHWGVERCIVKPIQPEEILLTVNAFKLEDRVPDRSGN